MDRLFALPGNSRVESKLKNGNFYQRMNLMVMTERSLNHQLVDLKLAHRQKSSHDPIPFGWVGH